MIELVDVIISYRGHDALAIPEASFGNGKVTAVVGRNGSGKSTLLRALAGIIPYRGSIRVDGDELSGIPHLERARRTAYLPQTLSTPAMDVATLVGHGRFSRLGPLRAMGADDRLIRRIFVLEGWLISLLGMAVGVVAGVALALLQQHFGLVKMPGNYIVDAYPVILKPGDVLISACGVALIGLAVAVAPVCRLSRPARSSKAVTN